VSDVRWAHLAVTGTEVRLACAGPAESDRAVVFVHGNPGSADDWTALLGAVGPLSRGVAIDLPDFGETVAPQGFEHTVPGYAAFLGEALEQLRVTRAHLVLHDFGGPIGLAWAAMHTSALESITLIDTGLLPGYRWHRLARIWRTPIVGEMFQALATRRSFRSLINRSEPRGLPREFLDRMYDHYDGRTRRAVLNLYRATDDPGGGAELVRHLRELDIPALVIWGKHDAYLPASFAERQRDAFPSAEVHVLPESGHWPFADAPETVEHLLVEFVTKATAVAR
jgi:pimeloyl-ACP methyl ester carboxylesterase